MNIKVIGYPFVSHVDQSVRPEMNFDLSKSFPLDGIVKRMGYLYDLRPQMKNYLVKQYGSWQEYWAPNKTLLRKEICGKIDRIVEVN